MKQKTFKLKNRDHIPSLIITSKDQDIDLLKECIHITVYTNNDKLYKYKFYAERFVIENNQKNTSIIELPVFESEIKVVVRAITDIDINKIKVFLKK